MIQVIGDRVLVALPPEVDEITTASGLVLVKDPDRFSTPTRGIVVALGEKSLTIDLDDALGVIKECSADSAMAMAYAIHEKLCELRHAPFDVVVGDCVIFPRSAGELIHDGDVDFVILRESDIIGIVEPKESAA